MNVTLTGATGLIGAGIVRALQARGDECHGPLAQPRPGARHPARRRGAWPGGPLDEPAPAAALSGRDAVVHLAGESVAQRWTEASRSAIHDSREIGTRNLVAGLAAAEPRPRLLGQRLGASTTTACEATSRSPRTPLPATTSSPVCASRGSARPPPLATSGCASSRCAPRSCSASDGGALSKMLPFFKPGHRRPRGRRRQYLPWIHADDIVGLYVAVLDGESWDGPANACAPEPATNRDFSQAPWAAPCTAPPSRPSPASRCACSTATWPRSSPRASGPSRAALEHGYAPAHQPRDRAARRARLISHQG